MLGLERFQQTWTTELNLTHADSSLLGSEVRRDYNESVWPWHSLQKKTSCSTLTTSSRLHTASSTSSVATSKLCFQLTKIARPQQHQSTCKTSTDPSLKYASPRICQSIRMGNRLQEVNPGRAPQVHQSPHRHQKKQDASQLSKRQTLVDHPPSQAGPRCYFPTLHGVAAGASSRFIRLASH